MYLDFSSIAFNLIHFHFKSYWKNTGQRTKVKNITNFYKRRWAKPFQKWGIMPWPAGWLEEQDARRHIETGQDYLLDKHNFYPPAVSPYSSMTEVKGLFRVTYVSPTVSLITKKSVKPKGGRLPLKPKLKKMFQIRRVWSLSAQSSLWTQKTASLSEGWSRIEQLKKYSLKMS